MNEATRGGFDLHKRKVRVEPAAMLDESPLGSTDLRWEGAQR